MLIQLRSLYIETIANVWVRLKASLEVRLKINLVERFQN